MREYKSPYQPLKHANSVRWMEKISNNDDLFILTNPLWWVFLILQLIGIIVKWIGENIWRFIIYTKDKHRSLEYCNKAIQHAKQCTSWPVWRIHRYKLLQQRRDYLLKKGLK